MKLDLSEAAKSDLRAIHSYSLERWGRARADAYLDDLRDRMGAVAKGELLGTTADDIRPGLRRQLVGTHAIWFRVQGDRLRVIRVLHQSRDAGLWIE